MVCSSLWIVRLVLRIHLRKGTFPSAINTLGDIVGVPSHPNTREKWKQVKETDPIFPGGSGLSLNLPNRTRGGSFRVGSHSFAAH